jgi:RNA polymerase sigma-70 factor (ECF subfamily)
VGSNIVPHEADLRARLRRLAVPEEEISDIVQDAYLSITRLEGVDHILNGRAYFFTTARMALLQRVRRERIVRIDSLTELEALTLADEYPGPERQVSARQELARVRALIEALPERCREIFELRRIHGLRPREVAEQLGISEDIVDQQTRRGLKLILKTLAGEVDEVRASARGRKVECRESNNG